MRWILSGLLTAALGACATPAFPESTGRDTDLLAADGVIEVGLDSTFDIAEIEFHVPAAALPEAVLAAAEKLMPGGAISGCEKEYHGRRLLWEVTKTIDGKESEVLFTPDGQVVDWEIQVDAADVPAAVIDGAKNAVGGGDLSSVEEIRDARRNLRHYHVKLVQDGIHYKIALSPTGDLESVVRETRAEIEVPLR